MKNKYNKIVLIEPICRGSRLQILENTINAIKSKYEKIVLITRPDYNTEHFKELMNSHLDCIEIITTKIDLKGAWIRNLKVKELFSYFHTLNKLLKREKFDVVVLMALDDYLLSFFVLVLYFRFITRKVRLYGFKYRVEYSIKSFRKRNLRENILNAVTKFSVYISNLRLITFDERLNNIQIGKYNVSTLPDPWFGDYKINKFKNRKHLGKHLGIDDEDFVVMTIGRQDERKGFPFLMESIDNILSISDKVKLLIVGKIDEKYSKHFAEKIKFYGQERIIHFSDFIPEEELPKVFSIPDVILLPYSKSFTSSSGVLARASASGCPVLTTAHGLVGFRVKKWGLGRTFDYGNKEEFIRGIEYFFKHRETIKETYSKNLWAFALSCSLEAFKKKLSNII